MIIPEIKQALIDFQLNLGWVLESPSLMTRTYRELGKFQLRLHKNNWCFYKQDQNNNWIPIQGGRYRFTLITPAGPVVRTYDEQA